MNGRLNFIRFPDFKVLLTIKKLRMVQCSMSVYVLSDRHGHNDPKIVFSTVPKKSKQRVHRGKDGEDNNKKYSMKSCQL